MYLPVDEIVTKSDIPPIILYYMLMDLGHSGGGEYRTVGNKYCFVTGILSLLVREDHIG